MELRHLKYFVAVAEQLSFSRAAEQVYVTQPALSQQIGKLEAELGVALFRRTKRRVELTEAGHILLDGARHALLKLDQSVRAAQEAGGAARQRLRVGFPGAVNYTRVAQILRAFQTQYPDVLLEQHEVLTLQETRQYVQKLRDGTLDVGFLLMPCDDEGDETLQRAHVLTVEFGVALPDDHPLAAQAAVPLRALAGERLIWFARHFHPGCYDHIVACCAAAGFKPRFVQTDEPQLYSAATTYRMVAAGIGLAIVAQPLAPAAPADGVTFRPLREPAPALELAAVWRPGDPSSAVQALVATIRGAT